MPDEPQEKDNESTEHKARIPSEKITESRRHSVISTMISSLNYIGRKPGELFSGYPSDANAISVGIASFPSLMSITSPLLDETTRAKLRELESDRAALRLQVEEQVVALRNSQSDAKEKEQELSKIKDTIKRFEEKERLSFLVNHVRQEAQSVLLQSEKFRDQFLNNEECAVFVLSVDIRRSTELMLKARSPEQFASFITALCNDLMRIVTENYGVIDKFTGDGILAFFPDFYSGEDAGYYALTAAALCHQAFKTHYRESRNSFSSILVDVGLGIGIDHGRAHLVQVAGSLTVVGAPVVYACRLSGAPAGTTLLNQPAYEKISDQFSANFFVTETKVEIKHEGRILAYSAMPSGRSYVPKIPEWLTTQQETQ